MASRISPTLTILERRTIPLSRLDLGAVRCLLSGGIGVPSAYWDLKQAGIEGVGDLYQANCIPYVEVLANKRKYFISDSNPHGVCLIEGDNLLPVGHLLTMNAYLRDNTYRKNYIEMWIDSNGDHKPEPDEITTVFTIQGKPLPALSGSVGSTWMDANGDVYISAWNNTVVKDSVRWIR